MSTSQQSSDTSYKIEEVPLDDIIPYWRNPRRISDEAINGVAESIQRYGFLQPIVTDAEGVIIVGHTRYAALRRLNMATALVHRATGLSADKVQEYRVIDNRVAEYTSWDFDALMTELENLSGSVLDFFPEVGDIHDDGSPAIEDSQADTTAASSHEEDGTADLICPSCFHSFVVKVTLDNIRRGRIN